MKKLAGRDFEDILQVSVLWLSQLDAATEVTFSVGSLFSRVF